LILLASAVTALIVGVPSAASADNGLVKCVQAWNKAPLGNGRRLVNGDSVAGRAALMVRFSDGVCGVVFPGRNREPPSAFGVYVRSLHGDYAWLMNPADPTAATSENLVALESLADEHTNVRVLAPSGRLGATTGDIVDVSFPSATSAGAKCPEIYVMPTADTYRVVRREVSCGLTRELIFAYSDGEGRPVRHTAHSRIILGWRCSAPRSLAKVDCTKGARAVRVRGIRPRVVGA
jgi:hypothetical protein